MNYKYMGEKIYESIYNRVRRKSAISRRIHEFKHKSSKSALTKEQIAAVKSFYKDYMIPNMVFHRYFTEKSGVFHADYIPQDIYVGYIDSYFNDIKGAKYFDNKCNYDSIFHSIPQPGFIAKRENGIWLNPDNEAISCENDWKELLTDHGDLFIKEAQFSSGGMSVVYVKSDDNAYEKIMEFAHNVHSDIIVQKGIKQHAAMAAINSSSVNSLRIYSVLHKNGEVKVYSAVVRMGVGKSKIDNYSAGGLACGIDESGKLKKYAYDKHSKKIEIHPTSNITFEGYEIPSYCEAVKLVKKAHLLIPHFRSVAWDIAISEDGSPVMIETNLCRGGIDSLQLCNGPLYGKDTNKVLDEVFKKTR